MESTEVVQEAVQEEEYHWIIRLELNRRYNQVRTRIAMEAVQEEELDLRIRSADNQVRTRIVMEAVREEEYSWLKIRLELDLWTIK